LYAWTRGLQTGGANRWHAGMLGLVRLRTLPFFSRTYSHPKALDDVAPVFTITTRQDKRDSPANDLVKRQFKASDPNQLWVADMAYVPTWTGFLYLAVVMDVWSRRVVGWSMGERMTTDLVLSTLNMALTQRKPQNVIHHSDQGSQYTAWPSASAAVRWVFASQWELWEMPMTMGWLRASSPA